MREGYTTDWLVTVTGHCSTHVPTQPSFRTQVELDRHLPLKVPFAELLAQGLSSPARGNCSPSELFVDKIMDQGLCLPSLLLRLTPPLCEAHLEQ